MLNGETQRRAEQRNANIKYFVFSVGNRSHILSRLLLHVVYLLEIENEPLWRSGTITSDCKSLIGRHGFDPYSDN